MTTYPLSEPATIYTNDEAGEATSAMRGKGTLAECADIWEGLSPDDRSSVSIRMDDLALSYQPAEVAELVRFLREDEKGGLSNKDIAGIANKIE